MSDYSTSLTVLVVTRLAMIRLKRSKEIKFSDESDYIRPAPIQFCKIHRKSAVKDC